MKTAAPFIKTATLQKSSEKARPSFRSHRVHLQQRKSDIN